MNWLNVAAHNIARAVGLDYRRYDPFNFVCLRRAHFMSVLGVRKVLDVGAHIGGYGLELRENGYRGTVVSFEPLAAPFQRLASVAAQDGNWNVHRLALGSTDGEAKINVSGHLSSSSFLKMTGAHEAASPESKYLGEEAVRVRRLDTCVTMDEIQSSPVWLKVDVQGFEKNVLEGAGSLLREFAGIELELSLVPVYEGAPLAEEMIAYLRQHGFAPTSFEDVMVDPSTAQVLQVNGMFLRYIRS
jgi:FkbM family methyltransferase